MVYIENAILPKEDYRGDREKRFLSLESLQAKR